MRTSACSYLVWTACVSSLLGCGGVDPNRKETIPVTGVVNVDGQPAEGIQLVFHPEAGMDQAQPTQTKAMTIADGTFAASTYAVGDGAPVGKYQITITWPKLNKISMTFDGDNLKGRYKDPKKSEWSVSVVSGSPVDLGTIELKSK